MTNLMKTEEGRRARYMADLLSSTLVGRMGKTFSGDRDLFDSLGYRGDPTFDDYLAYYTRGDIAARVVDLPPEACWSKPPIITCEDEKFVEAVKLLNSRVALWHNLAKLDRLSGVGKYACMMWGTRGESIESEPAKSSVVDPGRVLYLQVFMEGQAEIDGFVTDGESPRFALPEFYKLDVTLGSKNKITKVPGLRTIHLAEDVLHGRSIGTPRLQKVLNRFDDLNRTLGSTSEAFWQLVGGIWHADLSPDVSADDDDMEEFEQDMIEAYHGVRRFLQTRGVTLNQVGRDPADPEHLVEALERYIAAASGIPLRVLTGSERGQLASNQDQKEWENRTEQRREQHVGPSVVRPTIDRFIELGYLPVPAGSVTAKEGETSSFAYDLKWQPLRVLSLEERAEHASKIADACAKMAPGGQGHLIIPEWEFREMYLGLDPVPPEAPADYPLFDVGDDE